MERHRFPNSPTELRQFALEIREVFSDIPADCVRILAIDGRSAAGKSTLAESLAREFGGAGIVHLDDFFLPVDLRTPERLAMPGGNVHSERFQAEVLPYLRSPSSFGYRRFDCACGDYAAQPREVAAGLWRIVEGAYAQHPLFGEYAGLRLFLDVDPQEQLRRIIARNGVPRAEIFRTRWIPLEEKYIQAYQIDKKSNWIVG